jgi:hypothetical protein
VKLLFAPIGILGGILAGFISKSIFDFIWARIFDEEAPEPDQRDIQGAKFVAALLLEGAIFRLSRGLVERVSRQGFYRLTGTWPGEEAPDRT